MATPTQSGYQCKFVDDVKDFECPVCLYVTREPNLTSCCGQHFCHYCIQTILSNNKPCPFCKENSFMAFLDKKQKRRVLDLKVYCSNKELCTWFGNLGELEQHLTENCQFVLGDCSYSCGQMMMKLHLEDHEANYCPKRPHSCEYCQLKGTYQDIQKDHVPVCPKYPVTCPNECKATSLLRAQLKQHLEECPLAMVECELREVGCEEMVQRKDLDRHMEEAALKHLKLSTSYFLTNQRLLGNEVNKLQHENEKLRQDWKKSQEQHQKEYENTKEQHKKELSLLADQVNSLVRNMPILADQILRRYMPAVAGVVDINVNYRELKYSSRRKFNYKHSFSGHTVTINLHVQRNYYGSCLIINVEFTMDENDKLKWPTVFSMKVRLLNQAGDHGHHEVSGNTLYADSQKKTWNDEVRIAWNVIENPPSEIQFVADNIIKIEIAV